MSGSTTSAGIKEVDLLHITNAPYRDISYRLVLYLDGLKVTLAAESLLQLNVSIALLSSGAFSVRSCERIGSWPCAARSLHAQPWLEGLRRVVARFPAGSSTVFSDLKEVNDTTVTADAVSV